MNFETFSGVYENAKIVSRILGNGENTVDVLKRVAAHPQLAVQLSLALVNLDAHLRVMGFEDVVIVERGSLTSGDRKHIL